MYAYEYIEGELLKDIWPSLTEEEKIALCRAIGHFHAEIGKKFTKEMAENIAITIDPSADLHPEVKKEYEELTIDPNVPEEFKTLVKHAKTIFDGTMGNTVFQFIHNDAHHENILIKGNMITGIIDFGNAEYGEIAKEFSRYIRDFPDHFKYIVASYEEASGNKLSYERLISNALVSGFAEIVEDYKKDEEGKSIAKIAIAKYADLLR